MSTNRIDINRLRERYKINFKDSRGRYSEYEQPVSPIYFNDLRKVYKGPEYSDPRSYKHVSRYQSTRTIINNGPTIQESVNRIIIKESRNDTFYTVSEKESNRLDIIANKFYGFSLYWWVIAAANNIQDPFDIPLDTVLRIPVFQTLYDKDGVLYK